METDRADHLGKPAATCGDCSTSWMTWDGRTDDDILPPQAKWGEDACPQISSKHILLNCKFKGPKTLRIIILNSSEKCQSLCSSPRTANWSAYSRWHFDRNSL